MTVDKNRTKKYMYIVAVAVLIWLWLVEYVCIYIYISDETLAGISQASFPRGPMGLMADGAPAAYGAPGHGRPPFP